jgi:4-hydroxybenzoyl-CoA thioesterase
LKRPAAPPKRISAKAEAMLTNTRTVLVEFGHCDPSGIVYNPNYFIWFDSSVHALLGRGGLSLKAMIAEFGIDGIPVVEYRSKFLSASRWGDELRIESRIAKLHRCAFDIEHRVVNADVVAVECAETRVLTGLDAQGRPRGRKLPDKVVALLSGSLA